VADIRLEAARLDRVEQTELAKQLVRGGWYGLGQLASRCRRRPDEGYVVGPSGEQGRRRTAGRARAEDDDLVLVTTQLMS
jgi:hypothetical protein